MIGGPSVDADADADVLSSALPTHVSKAAHDPVVAKPPSARARVPRRDTPRSPLTRDLFDGGHGTSESDDLDEDDLAAIARGLEQRTAALKLGVRATHARRIGAVDAALAKLQLAVAGADGAKVHPNTHRATTSTRLDATDNTHTHADGHRARSQQDARDRRRLLNRVGVDLAATSRSFGSAVDARVRDASNKVLRGAPSRFAAEAAASGVITVGTTTNDKNAKAKGPGGSTKSVKIKPVADDPDAEVTGELKFNAQSVKTQPLRDWLLAHFDKPYPDDEDKVKLAEASGMTRAQVGNWFINARVRIWRPMVLRLGEEIERESD
ncbi:predicted protein [Micromonas commoda]|uniref:Homeobox domain-containing protein n=1 Tax=Micromonas commoda (strain RCC299 / NOUM17 / CCMP2709) TaxID=296587 RepID=C1EH96_MICCC|nr:predicted protein [Micromonas commoda]ACO67468.1 predicted protein [Micromonas commoda]|eukprot:XP_002506210.1 predicted protein [Micromonas commoda]